MKLLEHRFGYGLSIFVLLISVFAFVQARELQSVSAWFPLFVSGAGAVVAAIVITTDIVVDRHARIGKSVPATVSAGVDSPESTAGPMPDTAEAEEDTTPAAVVLLGFGKYILWFIGFAVVLLLVGMPLGVFLWTFGFIRFGARESWLRAVISAVAITVGLTVLAGILALAVPEGLLIDSNLIIPNWRL